VICALAPAHDFPWLGSSFRGRLVKLAGHPAFQQPLETLPLRVLFFLELLEPLPSDIARADGANFQKFPERIRETKFLPQIPSLLWRGIGADLFGDFIEPGTDAPGSPALGKTPRVRFGLGGEDVPDCRDQIGETGVIIGQDAAIPLLENPLEFLDAGVVPGLPRVSRLGALRAFSACRFAISS
jgi:hypothetical protein